MCLSARIPPQTNSRSQGYLERGRGPPRLGEQIYTPTEPCNTPPPQLRIKRLLYRTLLRMLINKSISEIGLIQGPGSREIKVQSQTTFGSECQ
jgi:hypothetical protein